MLYSTSNFTPMYGKFSTSIEELRAGDVFWHRVMIDPEDVADLSSETAKDVRNNRRTKRLVVVVCTAPLLVLYLATFNRATTLPNTLLDKSVWYPVDQAKSRDYISQPPLETEPRQSFAQWVNIRRLYLVNEISVVDRIGGFHFPEYAIERLATVLLERANTVAVQARVQHVCPAPVYPPSRDMTCGPHTLLVKV